MLRWEQTESLLKGIYLGLLVTMAWLGPTWAELGVVAALTLGGLAISLGTAAFRLLREGHRVRGRAVGFILFLLLENPGLVNAGLLIGLGLGTWITFQSHGKEITWEALIPLAGGACLGFVLDGMRLIKDARIRLGLGLALAAFLILGSAALFQERPDLLSHDQQAKLACLLLVGLPGFYLLTFASLQEESEIEIAAMCAALGISLWLIGHDSSPYYSVVSLGIPLSIYYLYTRYLLPELRILKHALRGLSYRQVGKTRQALISLGRALQLDPQNRLAKQQLWEIHREMEVAHLKEHPEILGLIDYSLCLERASWLLLQEAPSPTQLEEAQHLLEIVVSQQPDLQPSCAYWRAVACTHQKQIERAVEDLTSVLKQPQAETPARRSIHFAAWQLSLLLHPELQKRVGEPMLAQPGGRMDAIAATERQLAEVPADPTAHDLQRMLYSELTEAEYDTVAHGLMAKDVNHEYVQQLGLALLDDPIRWQRGCEYLRIAARGIPKLGPGIFIQIAQTHEKFGDQAGSWTNYQKAMQSGRALGFDNFAPEEKKTFFATVKKVGERARAEEQIDAALDAYKLYSQSDEAGLETYRILAELFEHKGDVWMALHCTEHAMSFNAHDPDLVARKDRYYISLDPAEVKERYDSIRLWFDIPYCMQKARWVLDRFNGDLELLDWARHLAELAQAAQPGSIAARFLRARVQRLQGEIPEAITLLENIRQNRPEKFVNQDEADSWYFAHRLLGDLYLDDKPDQAILCYQEFRESDHGGADTSYKMGRAFENLGDLGRAARYYQEVVGFTKHPLYYEAQDALERVQRALPSPR